MKMSRLLLPALLLGLALLFEPAAAQAAKRITVQNSSAYPIDTTVVVRTNSGWRVLGWYTVAPYSYRHLNFNNAGGQYFGYYAEIRRGPKASWGGKGNAPTIAVVGNAMNHDVRQQPYGRNLRRVKVRMVNGNNIHYTYKAPQQQRTTGWW